MAESGLVGYPGPLKAGDVYHVPQEYEGVYVSDETQRLIELERRVKLLEESGKLPPTQAEVETGWKGAGVYKYAGFSRVVLQLLQDEQGYAVVMPYGICWVGTEDLTPVRPLTTEEILTFVNTGDISHIPECQ